MRIIERSELQSRSTLVNRNVTVNGHRTSMRLEPAMWDALEDICRRENLTMHDVCSRVDNQRTQSSLTAAMRVFILGYFRTALQQQNNAAGAVFSATSPRAASPDVSGTP